MLGSKKAKSSTKIGASTAAAGAFCVTCSGSADTLGNPTKMQATT